MQQTSQAKLFELDPSLMLILRVFGCWASKSAIENDEFGVGEFLVLFLFYLNDFGLKTTRFSFKNEIQKSRKFFFQTFQKIKSRN